MILLEDLKFGKFYRTSGMVRQFVKPGSTYGLPDYACDCIVFRPYEGNAIIVHGVNEPGKRNVGIDFVNHLYFFEEVDNPFEEVPF